MTSFLVQRLRALSQRWRPQRPTHTLLLVTARQVVRVDGDEAGALLGEPQVFSFAARTLDQLPDVVHMSLSGKPAGRNLWVLCDAFKVQSLLVPQAQLAGLEGDMLTSALRFELEGSGVGIASDETVAHAIVSEADGMQTYALTLAPSELFEQVRAAARRAGACLQGLGSPAGLLRAVEEMEEKGWSRIEFWPHAVLGVGVSADGVRHFQVFRHPPNSAGLERELERWRKAVGTVEALESLSADVAEVAVAWLSRGYALTNEKDLGRWLAAWMRQVATLRPDKPWPVAWFRPPLRRLPEVGWMILGGALALMVCVAHFAWFKTQEVQAKAQSEALAKTEAEMKTLNEATRKLEEELEKQRKIAELQKNDGEAIPRVVAAMRQRYAQLLHELAVHMGDRMVLTRIAASAEGVEIEGVTLDVYQVDQLASMLTAPLEQLGWRMEPPAREDQRRFAQGGPWDYRLRLVDSGLSGFVISPKAETPP